MQVEFDIVLAFHPISLPAMFFLLREVFFAPLSVF